MVHQVLRLFLFVLAAVFSGIAFFSLVNTQSLFGPSSKSTLLPRDAGSITPPTQQNPQVAPPIPIIDLSSDYIAAANQSTSSKLRRNLFDPTDLTAFDSFTLDKRDAEPCAVGSPCPDGSLTNDNGEAPCQEGFGLCEVVPPPSCGVGSGTTNGRTIGYYQASNVQDRLCNKVSPSQIVTDGITHLYYAFAAFDPNSYAIQRDNETLYKEFTALKNSNLQTWIAIGGFDFSDPGPTRTAWSNMTQTKAGRAAFISSLQSFMSDYGFQGVDLDWEYPATPERGGQRADTENYVSLVTEMRASFGTKYGISVTLAPDYWYLRGFNASAMEPSVDWFGFMAYDLHGSWDADAKTLGSAVQAQTDIRDIGNDTLPLWFDALTPSKINFGLAYYGRGYTLADPSCNTLLCPFSGPSKPGTCTNFAGVMSLREIEQVIDQRGIQPTLIEDAMVKQITWADQWIGYDDADTFKLKKAWADGQCFGGTMIWSLDFNSGAGSGDTPPVTTDGTCGLDNGETETVAHLPAIAAVMPHTVGTDARVEIAQSVARRPTGPAEQAGKTHSVVTSQVVRVVHPQASVAMTKPIAVQAVNPDVRLPNNFRYSTITLAIVAMGLLTVELDAKVEIVSLEPDK
ncbi:MAG: hypothetical protein M1821_000473 [Bathelium mastoideum]|nr:MAG: hypothetical protein M1821_000473 [Bathelium mastoideum]